MHQGQGTDKLLFSALEQVNIFIVDVFVCIDSHTGIILPTAQAVKFLVGSLLVPYVDFCLLFGDLASGQILTLTPLLKRRVIILEQYLCCYNKLHLF